MLILEEMPKIRSYYNDYCLGKLVDTHLFRLCGELYESKCFIDILWEITSFGNGYDNYMCDIKQRKPQKFTRGSMGL